MAARALPDLVARIRLDSTGVDSAMSNLVGSFGRANLALAGVAAGLGLLFVAGKSAVDIAKEHFVAENNLSNAIEHSAKVITPSIAAVKAYNAARAALAQAEKGTYVPATHLTELQLMRLQDAEARVANTTGQARVHALRRLAELQVEYGSKVHGASVQVGNLAALEARVAKAQEAMGKTIKIAGVNDAEVRQSLLLFLQTNRDFISSQNEVTNAYANLVREGVKAKDLSRLMSIALNIQATEGGTLTDAVGKLQQAEVGRNKGLSTAIGLTLQAVPAHASYADKLKIVHRNIDAVARAYGTGKPKVNEMTTASNRLKTSWEQIAEVAGPELIGALGAVGGAVANFLGWLSDPKSYENLDQRLVDLAGKLRAVALQLRIATPTAAELPENQVMGGRVISGNGVTSPGAMTAAQLDAYFRKNLTKEEYAHWAKIAADKQDASLKFWQDYAAKSLSAYQKIAVAIDGIPGYSAFPPTTVAHIAATIRRNSRANDRAQ